MMNRRVQRLGFAFGAVLLITFLWVQLFPSRDFTDPATRADASQAGSAGREPTAVSTDPFVEPATSPIPGSTAEPEASSADMLESPAGIQRDMRTYAVSTYELSGLPPDAAPGTKLEVWAAWEPPLVDTPQFQKILKEVTLEKIVPGLTPEAPSTALLLVSAKDLPDLLYSDRFAQLSVAVIPH
jgi:hypothetical protein